MIAAALVAVLAAARSAPLAAPAAPPCAPMTFEAALAAPAAGDLYLRPGAAACDRLEVQVAAHGVQGIFTVSFDLAYPAAVLKYDGFEPGGLLLKGAPRTRPLFLVQSPAPGVVQASLTRFAPDSAVAAEGSEVLLTLRFKRLAPGSGSVDFRLGAADGIAEHVIDAAGRAVAASFGPGHGGKVAAP